MAPSVEVMNMNAQDEQYGDDLLLGGDGDADYESEEETDRCSPVAGSSSSGIISGEGITRPGEHDVLLGRGGGTNNHAGNITFRKLVNEHKMRYLACSKVDKPKVAREVVQLWRKLTPPGRFLARRDETKRGPGSVKAVDNVWFEVGDKKAREKASQCLRERTPDVMPYIKQLREQQDAITEHGVSMVQQQLQMHQQHHIHQQQMLMSPQPHPGAAFSDFGARSPMGTQPFPGRRTSMPGPPEPALMLGQQPTPMFAHSRSASCGTPSHLFHNNHHHGNSNSLSPHGGRHASLGQMGQAPVPVGDFYDLSDTHNAGFVGDNGMSDLEYQQNMMMMQQQVQMQQMQMHQMQQQRMQRTAGGFPHHQQQQQLLQPHQQHQTQLHQFGGAHSGINTENLGNINTDILDPFPVQSDPLMDLTADVFRHQDSSSDSSSPKSGSQQNQQQHQQQPQHHQQQQQHHSSIIQAKRSRDPTFERHIPDRACTSTSLMSYNPIPADSDEGGEMTIEEYRKQLEAYIENIENSNDQPNAAAAATTLTGEDHDEYASDLEDDWEKEREKNLRYTSDNKPQSRGVGRNTSGLSFMSAKTTKTNMSMISGISESMFSDLVSVATREQKMSAARSTCSNQSLMSELTDLSENIDKLGLDD